MNWQIRRPFVGTAGGVGLAKLAALNSTRGQFRKPNADCPHFAFATGHPNGERPGSASAAGHPSRKRP
eukprot:5236158-Lingulodinium_polyedra.AAC.1